MLWPTEPFGPLPASPRGSCLPAPSHRRGPGIVPPSRRCPCVPGAPATLYGRLGIYFGALPRLPTCTVFLLQPVRDLPRRLFPRARSVLYDAMWFGVRCSSPLLSSPLPTLSYNESLPPPPNNVRLFIHPLFIGFYLTTCHSFYSGRPLGVAAGTGLAPPTLFPGPWLRDARPIAGAALFWIAGGNGPPTLTLYTNIDDPNFSGGGVPMFPVRSYDLWSRLSRTIHPLHSSPPFSIGHSSLTPQFLIPFYRALPRTFLSGRLYLPEGVSLPTPRKPSDPRFSLRPSHYPFGAPHRASPRPLVPAPAARSPRPPGGFLLLSRPPTRVVPFPLEIRCHPPEHVVLLHWCP